MALTDPQKAAFASWLQQGDSLSQIQAKLKDEFEITMTFMEVRFLIDDLNLEVKKVIPPEEPVGEAKEDIEPEPEGVSIEVDVIVTPGSIVSGTVRFKDGVQAKWQLDQLGRLGLSGVDQGYQPSPEDIQEFQTKLQEELQKKGLG